jgi:hypothetical protein
MRNCEICKKPIVLVPSARERASHCGGSSKDYEDLFTTHASCAIDKRTHESIELMRKLNAEA